MYVSVVDFRVQGLLFGDCSRCDRRALCMQGAVHVVPLTQASYMFDIIVYLT